MQFSLKLFNVTTPFQMLTGQRRCSHNVLADYFLGSTVQKVLY